MSMERGKAGRLRKEDHVQVIAEKSEAIRQLRRRVKNRDQNIADLKKEIAALEKKVAGSKAETAAMAAMVKEVQRENKSLKKAYETNKAARHRQAKQNEHLRRRIRKMEI